MVIGLKFVRLTHDTLRGANRIVSVSVKSSKKVSTIVKTGVSGADAVIGVSHALEDFTCGDTVCATFDVVGSLASAVGIVLGNIDSTRPLTVVTGSFTLGCRCVRFYCKRYGSFWGCTAAVGEGIKQVVKFSVKH